jgi:hypothetical protein
MIHIGVDDLQVSFNNKVSVLRVFLKTTTEKV